MLQRDATRSHFCTEIGALTFTSNAVIFLSVEPQKPFSCRLHQSCGTGVQSMCDDENVLAPEQPHRQQQLGILGANLFSPF